MRRLLSLVLDLALLLGCAAAETAEPRNEDAQITSKNLPLYYQKADRIWREDFPVYFLDGVEDLPLINLADWADFMVYLYNESDNNGENVYSLTCEVNEEEKWVKLTRETGSSAVFDFSQGIIAFDDYIAFLTPQNCSYMEVSGIPKTKNGEPFLIQYTRSRILYGEVTAVNLKEYAIPMAAQDGKYLPSTADLSGKRAGAGSSGAAWPGHSRSPARRPRETRAYDPIHRSQSSEYEQEVKGKHDGSEQYEGKQTRKGLSERTLYGSRLYHNGGCRCRVACFMPQGTGCL